MPRLIWVFAGRTVTLFVLSWGGSFNQVNRSLSTLTMSQQPDTYAYCENEKNQNAIFSKRQNVSGINSNSVWRCYFMQCNNNKFSKIAPSGNLKFQKQKKKKKKKRWNVTQKIKQISLQRTWYDKLHIWPPENPVCKRYILRLNVVVEQSSNLEGNIMCKLKWHVSPQSFLF